MSQRTEEGEAEDMSDKHQFPECQEAMPPEVVGEKDHSSQRRIWMVKRENLETADERRQREICKDK